MCRILVQDDPDFLLRIPAPDAPHKTAHINGIFTQIERPMDLSAVHIIQQKYVEPPPRLLPFFQDQAFGRGISTAPVGLDDHGFDIKKEQIKLEIRFDALNRSKEIFVYNL